MQKQEHPIHSRSIEAKISDTIVRFRQILSRDEEVQQSIHDLILSIEDRDTCFTEEESVLAKSILNASLSLSFLIINHDAELDKFLDYHN